MSILRANALHIPLAEESVHCVVTSPPYWSLRRYPIPDLRWPDGWVGQLGLEPTVAAYISHMVQVFREVWRVLRSDGTCWVNIGDSYANPGHYKGNTGTESGSRASVAKVETDTMRYSKTGDGLKNKDLCLIPERLAIALQDDGWYVRSRIAWCKRAPMPESCGDRPTTAWEHIWLLTKSEKYYYDADAVRETALPDAKMTPFRGAAYVNQGHAPDNSTHKGDIWRGEYDVTGRNQRNWWLLGPEPNSDAYCPACDFLYQRVPPLPKCFECGLVFLTPTSKDPDCPHCGATRLNRCPACGGPLTGHFAAFPSEVVERAVKAGTSEKGCCAQCGAPWRRVVEVESRPNWNGGANQKHDGTYYRPNIGGVGNDRREKRALGWQPTCAHNAHVEPCRVLDPFLGSGTVGQVAESLGRRWVGLELAQDYGRMARKRTPQPGLFT